MPELEKAYIVEINDPTPDEISPRFHVQFNPTSLKLQISTTKVDPTMASQVRQSLGSGTTILSLELVFDTSDEGSTERPHSVREKTEQVERFTLPKNPHEINGKPPRIRFQWGSFFINGVVDGVNVDLDHFAANGTPLRAKVNLSITEQKSKLIFAKGNQKGNVPSPLGTAAGSLGISGGLGVSAGVNAQFGVALGGESLPEFSARVGLDPTAWRGLSTDISGGLSGDLSLEAGAEVGFSAGLNASAGIGVTLGVEAGVSASLEASFGLEANASISAVAGVGAGADLAAGFSLSAGGGLNAALEAVQIVKSQAAEQQTRQAFGAPPAAAAGAVTVTAGGTPTTALPPAAPPKPAPPDQPRPPLTITGLPSPSQQQSAAPAPLPPRADPRSASFGFGVPLRSTVGEAATQRADSLLGGVSLRQQVGDGLPPASDDPTVPPWIALPSRDRARAAANQLQKKLHPARPCGCSGRCRHTGGH